LGVLRKGKMMDELGRRSKTELSGRKAEKSKGRMEVLKEAGAMGLCRRARDTIEERRRCGNGTKEGGRRGGNRAAQTETSLSQGHTDL
jgi:hypothetical protein